MVMPHFAVPLRLLAATLVVVLVAGVALPAVVYACAATGETHLAACCGDREVPPPCHPAPADVPLGELPTPVHLAACCTASGTLTGEEAALIELPRTPLVVACEVTASPWAPPTPASDREAGPAPTLPDPPGLGLHLRYGVLLN
jgi:hypothetical protein